MQKRLANWGNFPVVASDENSFTQEDQLRQYVMSHTHIIARGNGRCYGDASLGRHSISMLNTTRCWILTSQQVSLMCRRV